MITAAQDRLVTRTPFFYGWIILAVGTIGLIFSSPGQTYAVSIFIEHFITDFGISRSLVSTLYTVGTLTSAMILPTIGRQIDQRGSRLMMAIIIIALGIACAYMSTVQNAAMLLLGFIVIRLAGQGSLTLVSYNVINQWWVRRRGMAVGLAGLGMSLVGVGGFPNLIQRLITLFGWRVSYTLLGAGIVVILLPLALIFIRNTPETVGLQPDGLQPDGLQPDGLQPDGLQPDDVQSGEKATPAQESDSTGAALEDNWTRAEALRTVAFWVFSLGSMAIAMLSTGLFFHLISIFADNGFSAETAALVFLPAAISSAIFNVTGGFLSDRIDVRFLLVAALLLETGAMVLAPLLNSVPLIFVYGVLLGGVGGLSGTVGSVVWAKYFGRKHLGSISGLATTILVFGAALGPMPIGIARDLLGSYDVVLWGFALLPLALAFLVLAFGKRPVRQ